VRFEIAHQMKSPTHPHVPPLKHQYPATGVVPPAIVPPLIWRLACRTAFPRIFKSCACCLAQSSLVTRQS
jgi:hypothetical protein